MNMQCVILAGGLATRLRPTTDNIPKSMIKIRNKPFLAYQIDLLRRSNVTDIILCISYLGEQIQSYFGDGKRFGVNIRYSYEKEQLLGTGGAIRNALDLLEDSFFVLYGDSYVKVDYRGIYEYFLKIDSPALLIVYKNKNRWDRSNVVFWNGIVEVYDKEKPISEMKYIDYGLSVLLKEQIKDIPRNTPYDLADLYKKLAKEGKTAGHEAFNRFYEIGSKNGLEEFESFINKRE